MQTSLSHRLRLALSASLLCGASLLAVHAQVLELTEPTPGTLLVTYVNTTAGPQAIDGNGAIQIDVPPGTFATLPTVTTQPGFTLLSGGTSTGVRLETACSPGLESLVVDVQTSITNPIPAGGSVPVISFPRPTCTNVAGDIELSTSCGFFFTSSVGVFPFITISVAGPSATAGSVPCDPFAPFPVELLGFSAEPTAKGTSYLEWATASERDNEGFVVERSFDGDSWQDLGFVEGKGDSRDEVRYSFVDEYPARGVNYYRLRQLDYDGTAKLSPVRSVTFRSGGDRLVSAFPNPTRGWTTLKVYEGPLDIRVTDAAGRVVLELNGQDAPGGTFELDLSTLRPAPYKLQVRQGEETYTLPVYRVE